MSLHSISQSASHCFSHTYPVFWPKWKHGVNKLKLKKRKIPLEICGDINMFQTIFLRTTILTCYKIGSLLCWWEKQNMTLMISGILIQERAHRQEHFSSSASFISPPRLLPFSPGVKWIPLPHTHTHNWKYGINFTWQLPGSLRPMSY